MDTLTQQAISAALSGDWALAVKLNQDIIKSSPEDVDALTRLARALAESGELEKARKTAKKVLKLDPYNKIASKSLEKWKSLSPKSFSSPSTSLTEVFLEEPGKTKIVDLMHLGSSSILARLDAGDEVKLVCHQHRASIMTLDDKYIGRLPDDLSARLKKLIKDGNQYQAIIKSADKRSVKVFIRETLKTEKLSDISSFPSEKLDYVSFTPPELVHKKEEVERELEEVED